MRSDNSVRFDLKTGRDNNKCGLETEDLQLDIPFGMKVATQFTPGAKSRHHIDFSKQLARRKDEIISKAA